MLTPVDWLLVFVQLLSRTGPLRVRRSALRCDGAETPEAPVPRDVRRSQLTRPRSRHGTTIAPSSDMFALWYFMPSLIECSGDGGAHRRSANGGAQSAWSSALGGSSVATS